MDDLTNRFTSSIKIILLNPQGEVIEDPGVLSYSARAQSLPDIHQLQSDADGTAPNIKNCFHKWRRQVEKRRLRYCIGEWTEKLTSTVSLGKIAEGFHKRNSVLEESFMMEYKWSTKNKSPSF